MVRGFGRSAAAALVAIAVTACGGGADGAGDGSIAVTCSPSRITTYLTSWETGQGLIVRATLSSEPAAAAYPQIVDSGGVLVPGPATVTANSDGSWSAHLAINSALTPGTYTGTFTLRLCKDVACTGTYPLTGNVVPYTITKTPPATTTATAELKVDGVVQTGTGGTLDANGVKRLVVTVPSGSVLDVTTSVPIVSWGFVTGASSPTVQYTAVAQTHVAARLTLAVPSDTSEGTTLRALAADGEMFIVAVTVTR